MEGGSDQPWQCPEGKDRSSCSQSWNLAHGGTSGWVRLRPPYLLQHYRLLLLKESLELGRREDLLHLLWSDHLRRHHSHRHGDLQGQRKGVNGSAGERWQLQWYFGALVTASLFWWPGRFLSISSPQERPHMVGQSLHPRQECPKHLEVESDKVLLNDTWHTQLQSPPFDRYPSPPARCPLSSPQSHRPVSKPKQRSECHL